MTFLYKIPGVDIYAVGVNEHCAREAVKLVHNVDVGKMELLGVAVSSDDVFCCPMSAQLIVEGGISV